MEISNKNSVAIIDNLDEIMKILKIEVSYETALNLVTDRYLAYLRGKNGK